MISTLKHRNIDSFIGLSLTQSEPFIVLEHAPIKYNQISKLLTFSLYQWIHNQKSNIDINLIIKILCDIANGMNYLHNNKISHRYLKSQNVWVFNKSSVVVDCKSLPQKI